MISSLRPLPSTATLHCTWPPQFPLQVMSPQKGKPMLPLQDMPGQAPWVDAQPSGAPAPGLFQGWGPAFPNPGWITWSITLFIFLSLAAHQDQSCIYIHSHAFKNGYWTASISPLIPQSLHIWLAYLRLKTTTTTNNNNRKFQINNWFMILAKHAKTSKSWVWTPASFTERKYCSSIPYYCDAVQVTTEILVILLKKNMFAVCKWENVFK